MSTKRVVVLGGDGIGPEIVEQALRVLKRVAEARNIPLSFEEHLLGGCAMDATGKPLPDETLAACQSAHAILLGAVGGPQYGTGKVRPEQGILAIRKALDLYANIRPALFPSPSLLAKSPLKEDRARGTHIIVLRELVGDIYYGERTEGDPKDPQGFATDRAEYSVSQIQRIARVAAHLALQSNPPLAVHSIDKANVLATSRLWRSVVTDLFAKEFPQLSIDHHLVDSASMLIVSRPTKLNGVLLCPNLFGDILSDETSVIPGSLGLLPSASLAGLPDGKSDCLGIYEPIHGSAPDIAGRGIANPVGTILSTAMMLRYSFNLPKEAELIEAAVSKALDTAENGGLECWTADLGGSRGSKDVGDAVLKCLEELL